MLTRLIRSLKPVILEKLDHHSRNEVKHIFEHAEASACGLLSQDALSPPLGYVSHQTRHSLILDNQSVECQKVAMQQVSQLSHCQSQIRLKSRLIQDLTVDLGHCQIIWLWFGMAINVLIDG